MEAFFLPKSADSASRVNITVSPHCDPLANVLNPGSGPWYSLDSEKPRDCGDGASLGLSQNRAQLQISAHGVDLCVGCSLRYMTVDLNRVNACHRELLRLGVHLAQAIDSLGPSPAFPYALPLTCGTSPFARSRLDHQISGCCPQTNGDSVSLKMADDQFPKGFVICQKR